MKAKTKIVECFSCKSMVERSLPAIRKAEIAGKGVFCDKCIYQKRHPKYSLEEAIKIKGEKLWKGMVSFVCRECGKHSMASYCKIVKRKYGKKLPICNDCIMKWTTNRKEWREKNSRAQKITQSSPEQRLKNSLSVKEACKREDVKAKKSIAMKKRYLNDEYKEKILRHLEKIRADDKTIENSQLKNKFKSGYVVIDEKPMFYNSGWELLYILFCKNKGIKIYRCKERIPYSFNGKSRIYIPDFVILCGGKKTIIEIKGRYPGSEELVLPKKEAAINFVNGSCTYDDYVIYYKEELVKIGIDISKKAIKEAINEAEAGYSHYKETIQR